MIFEAVFPYRSSVHTLTEWGDKDAQFFRDGLNTGYQELAIKIVEELFLLFRQPGFGALGTSGKFIAQKKY